MSLIKFLLLALFVYYNAQDEICVASGLPQDSETSENSRIQRSLSGLQIKQMSLFDCPAGNIQLCRRRLTLIYQRLVEQKRRCCRARHKACKRKFFKNCRKPKCYKKQSTKCLKRLKKCNKSRINPSSINRRSRPRQCSLIRFPKRKPSAPTKPKQRKVEEHQPFSTRKRLKERCTHDDECEAGLCCAQHHHVKICKQLIQEGQVCTRQFFSRKRSPDVFERCPCADSLVCARTESQHNTCQVPT